MVPLGIEFGVTFDGAGWQPAPYVEVYSPYTICSWSLTDPWDTPRPCKIEPVNVARDIPKLKGKPKPYYVDLDKHAKLRFR